MRQTNDQREATEALQAIAGRYRVEPDAEGWPVIESQQGRGRIEYHDGNDLAIWFEGRRITELTDRYVKRGCRRHQTGDTEARLLFAPALLGRIAQTIRCRYRVERTSYQGRSPEAMRAMTAARLARRSDPELPGAA